MLHLDFVRKSRCQAHRLAEYFSLTLGRQLAALHLGYYVLNGSPGVAGCKGPGTTSELQLLTTGSPASTFLIKGNESTSEPFTVPLCVRPG